MTTVNALAPTVDGVMTTEFVQTSTAYSCISGGSLSGSTCTIAATNYTAASSTSYYCSNGSLSGTSCNIAGYTYGATNSPYYSGYYSCNSGGSLSGTTCSTQQFKPFYQKYTFGPYNAGAGPAAGTYYYDYMTCGNSYGPTYYESYWRNANGTFSGAGYGMTLPQCYTTTYNASYNQTGPFNSYSCPSGGSLSGSTCTVSARTVSASSTTTYTCDAGDTRSGSTCTTPSRTYAATGTPVGYQNNLFTLNSVSGAQKVSINGNAITVGSKVSLGKCPGTTTVKAVGVGGATSKVLGNLCSA